MSSSGGIEPWAQEEWDEQEQRWVPASGKKKKGRAAPAVKIKKEQKEEVVEEDEVSMAGWDGACFGRRGAERNCQGPGRGSPVIAGEARHAPLPLNSWLIKSLVANLQGVAEVDEMLDGSDDGDGMDD